MNHKKNVSETELLLKLKKWLKDIPIGGDGRQFDPEPLIRFTLSDKAPVGLAKQDAPVIYEHFIQMKLREARMSPRDAFFEKTPVIRRRRKSEISAVDIGLFHDEETHLKMDCPTTKSVIENKLLKESFISTPQTRNMFDWNDIEKSNVKE
eukprot:g3874.t1